MFEPDFLTKLQAEAKLQAKLHQHRVFPTQLDWLTSFIGRYPWQVLLVASGIAAGVLEFGQYV